MDGIEEWSRAQQRVIGLVADMTPEQAGIVVPACPGWTVRELLAHMVGLGADVVAGDEPDDHNAGWTARQVARRQGRDVAELVAEWQEIAAPLRAWMAAHTTRPLNDVLIHEQDLRGALGVPGGRDSAGLAALRETFADRVAGRISEAGLPPLAMVGGTWRSGPVDAAVEIAASDFDLSRAVVTRRSAPQLRSWTRRGDVDPYLDAFALLGELPAADLSEQAG